MDDIIAINCPNFSNSVDNIYPAALTIEETKPKDGTASFLDLQIEFQPKFNTRVYNKTDDFNFKVVRYVFANSNMHRSLGPKICRTQLIRFARISTNADCFEERVLELVFNLMDNGFNKLSLLKTFCRFSEDFRGLLVSLGFIHQSDIIAIISRIFCR